MDASVQPTPSRRAAPRWRGVMVSDQTPQDPHWYLFGPRDSAGWPSVPAPTASRPPRPVSSTGAAPALHGTAAVREVSSERPAGRGVRGSGLGPPSAHPSPPPCRGHLPESVIDGRGRPGHGWRPSLRDLRWHCALPAAPSRPSGCCFESPVQPTSPTGRDPCVRSVAGASRRPRW